MKIGIDYSLSSPGVCVNTSKGEFRYEDCSFYYLTSTKKYDSTFKEKIAFGQSTVEYKGTQHKLYTSEPVSYTHLTLPTSDLV